MSVLPQSSEEVTELEEKEEEKGTSGGEMKRYSSDESINEDLIKVTSG